MKYVFHDRVAATGSQMPFNTLWPEHIPLTTIESGGSALVALTRRLRRKSKRTFRSEIMEGGDMAGMERGEGGGLTRGVCPGGEGGRGGGEVKRGGGDLRDGVRRDLSGFWDEREGCGG